MEVLMSRNLRLFRALLLTLDEWESLYVTANYSRCSISFLQNF